MRLSNPKRLARLMAIQDVGTRELARIAGYRSHSYLSRLLRGKEDGLRIEPAVRIAAYLDVNLYDIFTPQATSDTSRNGKGDVA